MTRELTLLLRAISIKYYNQNLQIKTENFRFQIQNLYPLPCQ